MLEKVKSFALAACLLSGAYCHADENSSARPFSIVLSLYEACWDKCDIAAVGACLAADVRLHGKTATAGELHLMDKAQVLEGFYGRWMDMAHGKATVVEDFSVTAIKNDSYLVRYAIVQPQLVGTEFRDHRIHGEEVIRLAKNGSTWGIAEIDYKCLNRVEIVNTSR